MEIADAFQQLNYNKMKNFKSFRRNKHRNNIRSFKNNNTAKFNGEFNISGEFKRKKISKKY